MRKHLAQEFDAIYVVDLKGNIRKDSMREGIPLGEKHTIFGLAAMVGISICFLIKNSNRKSREILIHEVPFRSSRTEKFELLDRADNLLTLEWTKITPDARHTWLREGLDNDFDTFTALGTKLSKQTHDGNERCIFKNYSLGIASNRDPWVYSYNLSTLRDRVAEFIEIYEVNLDRARRKNPKSAEEIIDTRDPRIKWTRQVKASLLRHQETSINPDHFRTVLYRPFAKQHLYFDDFWNEERYQQYKFFPRSETRNLAISMTAIGSEKPFISLMTEHLCDLHFTGAGTGAQCFPFFTYAEDGSNRQENITKWALNEIQRHYRDKKIDRWDIFYYVYAVLHHPQYRERYAANLRRELPRIPYAPDFHGFAAAGKLLAELHVNYEQQPEYYWHRIENRKALLSYRVEKMRLSKDKTSIVYNEFLTIVGIPPEVHEYRLGNRSALEWVIDQYQVSTDKRSGITNDPNRLDDPEYIVRLIGQVITVSLETVKIVKNLPPLEAEQ
jgi:predicted helicase